MLWVLATLAFAGAVKADDARISGVRLHQYKVKGESADVLVAAMASDSPYRDPQGSSWPGGTEYQLSWRWVPTRGAQCRVAPVKVTVSMVLPKVVTAAPLRDGVQAYLDALVVHERGHVDIVQAAVAELEQTLSAIPVGDCDAVGASVDQAGQRALAAMSKAHVRYDKTTGHGRTQRARLRPHLP
jgi:predicted secreted Zn-dependent protease